jgi:ferredoxin
MCAIAAPAVFGSDDYGNATVLIEGDIPDDLHAATRRAEGNCPEQAITIEE